jgi:methionine transaminase
VRAALDGTLFTVPPAEGTYFQLIDFSAISTADDVTFAERLLTEAGVATIPLSPFYKEPPRLTVLRLCIAKRDRTLDDAAARLHAFANGLKEETG